MACPEADVTVAFKGCTPEGKREVVFHVTIEDTDEAVVTELVAGGTHLGATADRQYSRTHHFTAPGPASAELRFIVPSCPPVQVPVARRLEPCPICPGVEVQTTVGACTEAGTRQVTFDVDVEAGDLPVVTEIAVGSIGLGATSERHYQRTHAFLPPAAGGVELRIIHPPDCAARAIAVPALEACPVCPGPDQITATAGACDGEKRRVTFTIPLGPAAVPASIDFGDGTSGVQTSAAGTWSVTHDYAPPGPYTAKVVVGGCPEVEVPTGTLEPCTGEPPPDQGGGREERPTDQPERPELPERPAWLCPLLEITWMALAIVALGWVVFAICLSREATGEDEHDTASLVALIAVVIVVAAIAVLAAWWLICKPSECRFWQDVFFVATWAGVLVGILFFFCRSAAIFPAGTLAALIVVIAATNLARLGCPVPRLLPRLDPLGRR